MKRLMIFLVLPLILIETSVCFANQAEANHPEDEWLITDRGSREKPTLYYYNKQNVQYNRRYNSSQNSYQSNKNSYDYNVSDLDTFNRSYYQDNTSPHLYLNQ